ncbi:MAG: SDR family NAD(P)-dependent oxidoreductase [Cyclobacteriaceae bacterium]|nr:SDR family NAD(P)-dependent oxidoreductase [Cyclobacteriaceae bacterium]MDW8331776.1 SDR family NAD(P)-dependent oxidoreductase [Cyclobacteriaceae bacterium]
MPVALITGAGGNLGQVAVSQFLQKGWTVLATVSPGKSWPGNPHPNLHCYAIDLRNQAAVSDWLREVFVSWNHIQAGLLLAGGFAPASLQQADGTSLKQMLALNAQTAWNVAQPLALHMMNRNNGRIFFIGARTALHPENAAGALTYAFSKSLLFRFSEAINHAGLQHNVRSYVLVPNIIDTPDNRRAMPSADFTSWVKPEYMVEIMIRLADSGYQSEETVLRLY